MSLKEIKAKKSQRAGLVAQQVKLPTICNASSLYRSLALGATCSTLSQLPGKAVGDSSSSWVPAAYVGDQILAPGDKLDQPWHWGVAVIRGVNQ